MGAEDDAGGEGPLQKRWATWSILAVNLSVFLAMVLAGVSPWIVGVGDLSAAGGVDPVRVWSGDVWRLLTACFVHVGIWHLALNMWVLVQLGRALEELIGGSRMLLVYLASGVFGFAASVALRGVPTAGASGAIFGVTGALMAIAILTKDKQLGKLLLHALVPFVAATLLLGYFLPMIDNLAHIGGLVMGFLAGYGLAAGDERIELTESGYDSRGRPTVERTPGPTGVWGVACLLAAGVLFLVVTAYAARPVLSPLYHASSGLAALREKRLDLARAHAARAAALAPDDGNTFILVGRIRAETAANDADRADAKRLLREGLVRFQQGRFNQGTHLDDPASSLAVIEAELGLLGGTPELPFEDDRTVNALCDAALDIVVVDEKRAAPNLKNECAWVKLKSTDPSVHDPAAGLVLAREAVLESDAKEAAIVHTLAEALSQNGEAQEGVALLEKLWAEGRGKELPGGDAWLRSERSRLLRIALHIEDARALESP